MIGEVYNRCLINDLFFNEWKIFLDLVRIIRVLGEIYEVVICSVFVGFI